MLYLLCYEFCPHHCYALGAFYTPVSWMILIILSFTALLPEQYDLFQRYVWTRTGNFLPSKRGCYFVCISSKLALLITYKGIIVNVKKQPTPKRSQQARSSAHVLGHNL